MSSSIKTLRLKAIRLRKSGKSYNEINKNLRIPKSTLSLWLKNLKMSQAVKKLNISNSKKIWAKNITIYNQQRAQKARLAAQQLQQNSCQEIQSINQQELKLIGAALYWAEGYNRAKWNALFCNSDPQMVKLMMRFFREICNVSADRFKPQVQIHPNILKENAEDYWAEIAGLNKTSFAKPLAQVSKSSKRKSTPHRLPYGTFRLRIADAKILYKIKGWIQGLSKLA